MEDKNEALMNETQTLFDCVNTLSGLCSRLTPNKTDVNAATIRSMNTAAEALKAEVFNLQRIIDDYAQ